MVSDWLRCSEETAASAGSLSPAEAQLYSDLLASIRNLMALENVAGNPDAVAAIVADQSQTWEKLAAEPDAETMDRICGILGTTREQFLSAVKSWTAKPTSKSKKIRSDAEPTA